MKIRSAIFVLAFLSAFLTPCFAHHTAVVVNKDNAVENVTSLDEAARSADDYVAALDEIAARGLPATVSIKVTQFGIDLSEAACLENVRRLARRAQETGSRVEIDMESTRYTDRTLAVAKSVAAEFGDVRCVIQAYLRRSAMDIEDLNRRGIPVRLCKGAYEEPPELAFPSKREVDENYIRLAKELLDHGAYPAIATHDPRMIKATLQYAKERKIGAGRFEFQMLYGIRREAQRQLIAQGYRLRLYVPYGTAWYPYFMRRLAERPANALFLARNLLR